MADAQDIVYNGNCHCGRYRFQVSAPQITGAVSCACSLCAKKGYLWLIPSEGAFKVVRDESRLAEYQSSALKDKFCNYCGTGVVGEHLTGPMRGQFLVNIRTIREPYVNPFEFESSTTAVEADEDKRAIGPLPDSPQHTFSCHCGNVRAALLVPIEGEELREDNCSTCVRAAYIGVYPTKDQVKIYGREHAFEYLHGRKYSGATYCKTCGVHVFGNVYGPPISIFDKLPPERREKALDVYHKNIQLQPVNVRVMDGLDLASLRPRINREDSGTDGYELEL